MTFSIVAVDRDAGEIGVGVQSKFLSVGAVVPWARAGVGAVATQAFADVTFGPRGLELLTAGLEPSEVLERLLEGDERREERQVGVVDAAGGAESFTGSGCFEHAASATGDGFACQGNILATAEVVPAMAGSFRGSAGPLAERLLEALRAAQREGGDRRGQESSALLVVKPGGGYGGNHDRYLDLRVDHHDRPIEELGRLLDLHALYLQRPNKDEVIVADAALESELRRLLGELGVVDAGGDLWDALEEHMSWQNLEERWVGRGRIDPVVLRYLKERAGGESTTDPSTLRPGGH